MLRKQLTVILAATVCLTCDDSTGPGSGSVTLGNGTLRTFLTLDQAGNPTTVGATFGAGMLTGLPTVDTFMTVALPAGAGNTVFTHLYFDYVPHGHEPIGVYDTAHFDFHFYVISDAERATIAAGLDTIAVPPQFIPPDYKKVSEVIGRMGVHWADSTNPEFTSGVAAYTQSFVYGYHEGAFEFYDIMITKAYLESQPDFTGPIKQPAAFPTSGHYPTQWSLSYDAARQEYRVALEGFVQR